MATANATVMFTDIRGFTARTSKGTREGLEELLETHEELLLPVIKHYDGRVVKTIGDAFLVVFESPTNAVLCGVMIQRRLMEFNESVAEDKRIEIRIAINSGEVTLRGDDVFGEPVNIAARIEGITEPNEIYFTEATYLTMQKAEVPSSEVGHRRLKGIPEEVKVYRVIQDEDNALYRAIVVQAGIADEEAIVGSLSVPEWPPRRGRLKGPRSSLLPVLLLAVLIAGGYLAFRAWRESHRYDDARAALAAADWSEAQRLAGALWSDRGEDQEAIRILTEAISGEIGDLVEAGDPKALQDTWTERRLAWGNLPAREDLDRRVAFGKLSILLGDVESVGDQRSLEDWTKRFGELEASYADQPGYADLRADAAYAMGMHLTASENNFWKDAGIQLFRTFLHENPDDKDRGWAARVRLVSLRRWHADPRQLLPYLEEDPKRGEDPRFRDALVAHLEHDYDLDGDEEKATREMFWTYWHESEIDRLHEWVRGPKLEPQLNAFVLLREHGLLHDDEADRVLLRVMLGFPSGYDAEMELALDHWAGLLRKDPEEAKRRANPQGRTEPLEPPALRHGAADTRWCEVVGALFFPRLQPVLISVLHQTGYPTERLAALRILERHDALGPALASRAHFLSVKQYVDESPGDIWPVLLVAVDHFAGVDPTEIRDVDAVREELKALSELVGKKVEQFGRRGTAWKDLQARVSAALANLDP